MILAGYKRCLITVLLLSTVVSIAHFLNLPHFGLYEDDYYFIVPPWHFPVFLEELKSALFSWPQGRPIGFILPQFISMAGVRLGGLPVIYLAGLLVLVLNVSLFYTLLRKISTETTAVIAALAFCLFPADTTHIFLTHSLCLQFSLTFWLIAAHGYLSGKRILPYLALTGTLLTYESPFMVFLAIPLLREKWDRALVLDLLRNAAIMAAIALLAVALRSHLGEGRVAGMVTDFPAVMHKIANAMILGPIVSMVQFVNAPVRALASWNLHMTFVAGASLLIVAWMVTRSMARSPGNALTGLPDAHAHAAENGNAALPRTPHPGNGRLLLAGAAMLCLAYVLSFTHYPPVANAGRLTSVHLASTIGGSLVFGCIGAAFLSVAGRFGARNLAVFLLALYLSLIVGYRYVIQLDFRQAWQNQRWFWTQVVSLVPDMTQDTVILVVGKGLPGTTYIRTHSWADPVMLAQLFKFPPQWGNPPRLFVVSGNWPGALKRRDGHFILPVPEATWEAHDEIFPDGNVVQLEMDNGRLIRRFGSIRVDGLDIHFKQLPPGESPRYDTTLLYKYLIGREM